ncbi:MAG: response regulator transcription factor [Candidatus Cryptobacteroides sp.]
MDNRIKAALVTPSAIVSRGLEAILEDSGSIHVCGSVPDIGPSGLSRLRSLDPDFVILDPTALDHSSRKNAKSSIAAYCDAPIVVIGNSVLSSDELRQYGGIISLYDDAPTIIRIVRAAMSPQDGTRQDNSDELSAREKEILVCVAQGMLNKEIADKFNLSIYTVITHRKNITRKTGIKSVAGLTVYALLNNLIDINSVE